MKNIKIKEFIPQDNPDDKKILFPAFLEVWNNPENLKFLSYTLEPFSQEEVKNWLENHKDQGGKYFCALKDNEVTGISVVKINKDKTLEIFALGVKPEFKKQGTATKLISYITDYALDQNFSEIQASVFTDNSKMLRIFLLFGFIPVDISFNKRIDGGDFLHLKKYLSAKI